MRWTKTALVLAVTVGLAIGGTAPSTAAPVADSSDAVGGDSVAATALAVGDRVLRASSPKEVQQLGIDSTRALIPGISDADAIAYNKASEAMSVLVLKLETEQSASFARAVAEVAAPFSATLTFKNAPASVLEATAASGVPGLKVVNDAKYTKAEQVEITNQALAAVTRLGLTKAASATYDWDSDTVTVYIVPKADIAVSQVTSKVATSTSLSGVSDVLRAPAPSKVVYEQAGDISGTVFTGGTALSAVRATPSAPNPKTVCTDAFGAVGNSSTHPSSRTGLLTAEHCDSSLVYEGRVNLQRPSPHNGSVRGDARFVWASGEGARADFITNQYSPGQFSTRPVFNTGSTYVGQKVCLYGSTTGPKYATSQEYCDTVRSVGNPFDFCNPNGNCYQFYNQTFTQRRMADLGDSGGPWFNGNTALGIQSGNLNSGVGSPTTYSTFQPISDAERKSGTRVMQAN